ncbi:Fe(3+) dicitrate ABC transporter ATP-binding protein FecE [Gynuella sunshinyii]|uniref:ABC-type cobalamin/Fe3+-siderophores transport system, ATPase component n=1 Tax=Gynuella sunshinyii YC6258 TaxID=1445510 RepID=A0A0C5VS97_9GAMM|nr:Fe(3+) dicitrate ABC transporter ATP-binding protein FecE [Gynuella sunshinyii]AJQ97547.1 ABC-type cobalamin/Fe3+-siderophores transport system, ATPase component [Gynuella sunshinyii YC6258]
MQLSTQNLVVGYDAETILNGIDLTVPDGKITALLGPNGCGKSTLLKTMARLLQPRSGQVLWQGQNLHRQPSRQIARQLAMLAQTQQIPEGVKVAELVAYGRSPYTGFWGRLDQTDRDIIERVMIQTGIQELAERMVTDLSGGQRQRVWLAMTLAQDTPYLLLDEPTTYMDLNHQVELMQLLRQLNRQGRTIVTVLHDINQACRYCDHLIVMANGAVHAQGTPTSVLTAELLEQVFSVKARIYPDPVAGTPMCVVE